MPLTTQQKDLISTIFLARKTVKPIKVCLRNIQTLARCNQIFELQYRGNEQYYLLPTDSDSNIINDPKGTFFFVVLANDPSRVYCGASREPRHPQHLQIQGHTSISHRADVLYAGELIFKNAKLLSWSNSSGHYKPQPELRHKNLLQPVKRLLPEHLFERSFSF